MFYEMGDIFTEIEFSYFRYCDKIEIVHARLILRKAGIRCYIQ